MDAQAENRRRAARNSAIALGCFVLALYVGYIAWSIHKAHG